PVSAYLKIRKDRYSFLLESVEGKEKIARFSFIGTKPSLVFLSKKRNIEVYNPAKNKADRFVTTTNHLDEIRNIMKDFKAAHIKGLPRFFGGLVGYMGYDMARFIEELPDKNPDTLNLPDSIFLLTDTVLIFDHFDHTINIVNNCLIPKKSAQRNARIKIYRDAIKKIEALHCQLKEPIPENRNKHMPKKALKIIKSNLTMSQFENSVRQAKEYIKKGDIIQTVLSQRFSTGINKDNFDIYRSLRSLNPSPYMYFLELKALTLIGSSPEMLVRCEDHVAQTRPIAGTRPRSHSEDIDKKLEKELLKDKKEKAEHIMLVDLGRNDLGRVCYPGKVRVSEFMAVERFSHVMHLVSEVTGIVDKKYDCFDVLKACFPAGTVSGSPKIRAMEIIDELENLRRGPYAGCVGYFSFSHNMDTCITIRTIIVKDKTAYVQAGAGIVADSVPAKEYTETVNKAKALFEAING
ncbi:MAG: anthranilate synthase component I, partial [Candidatus Omnitrophica bacterium]|nr:anthranilate synthase component I [Candidatus Omnitrophota bacterium]